MTPGGRLRGEIWRTLVPVALAAAIGCGSPTTSPRSAVPSATPGAAAQSVPATSAAPVVPTAAAQTSPASLGARMQVMLEVAPQFRTGRLAEPRTLTLPAG